MAPVLRNKLCRVYAPLTTTTNALHAKHVRCEKITYADAVRWPKDAFFIWHDAREHSVNLR